jgi:metal-responsive CopG/Arc/MetJ family transcriptional regulator
MKIISLQLTKEELEKIDRAQKTMGFRSRSEYVRQAVIKQAIKDCENES